VKDVILFEMNRCSHTSVEYVIRSKL